MLWGLACLGAYFAASDSIFELSGAVAAALLLLFVSYFYRLSAKARTASRQKRETRNAYLPSTIREIEARASPAGRDADRELSLEDLREIQYILDVASQAQDDWANIDTVDQFQTSALRYKLYEHMYCMGAYMGIYTPNFHGYLKEAFENTIEKSLTPRVLGFWKLERLWGRFSLDCDPVATENIMVTGFFLQGLMLYIALTQDERYNKPKSLKFRVSTSDVFEYDVHSLSAALVRQWNSEPYCLFSCEPNWIYTPCNLQGKPSTLIYA